MCFLLFVFSAPAMAAITPLNFTINMSEATTVVTTGGTPRIAVNVGGVTRYATYVSGSGSSSLIFAYTPVVGDVDLDGVTLSSPIDLNGGTMRDAVGNDAVLTFTPPNTANVRISYPSLSMNFIADADGRYTLSGTAYNDLPSFLTAVGGTFSRGSIGTFFNSSGVLQTASAGVARFDHDPVTLNPRGILIEEARTNFAIRSSELGDAAWSNFNCNVTSNSVAAPDGTLSADTVSRTSTSSNWISIDSTKGASSITYTGSVYAKMNTARHVALRLQGVYPARSDVSFDLQTGTVSTSTAVFSGFSNPSAVIQPVGGGWYRLSLTATTDATNIIRLVLSVRDTAGVIDGSDSSSSVNSYIWGAQLEQGAFPTSYIPTTNSTVSRTADIISLPTTSWHNVNEGTLAVNQTYTTDYANYSPTMGASHGNSFGLIYQGIFGTAVATFVNGSASASTGALGFSGLHKMAITHSSAGNAISRNGSVAATSATGKVLTGATTLFVGRDFNSVTSVPQHVETIRYYPVRVGNTQLQLMTQ